MFYRSGIRLGFFAVFLQIAVFLQPLLPAAYQISPVCETIMRALQLDAPTSSSHQDHTGGSHAMHMEMSEPMPHAAQSSHAHSTQPVSHDHHDINHQCQYCTVYAHLVLPPELGVKEVLISIQVRLLFFQRTLHHLYFALQRLFLLPQGRAPPVLT